MKLVKIEKNVNNFIFHFVFTSVFFSFFVINHFIFHMTHSSKNLAVEQIYKTKKCIAVGLQ